MKSFFILGQFLINLTKAILNTIVDLLTLNFDTMLTNRSFSLKV